MRFIASKEKFNEQSNLQKEAFRNVNNLQLLNTALSIGIGFKSKRTALGRLYHDKYDLSRDQLTRLTAENERLSLDDLTKLLQSESRREMQLQRLFNAVRLREDTARVERMFGRRVLNERQQEAVIGLFARNHVAE